MAKMVAHMGRMKKGNLSGAEGHNKRLFKNHSNKDIDTSKSYLNYDLVNCSGSYLDAFKNEMDKYYTGKKAPRKDAVMCNEWIFSASSEFFESVSQDEEKRFFKSCLEFMQERYGHVIYATVHKDESTPHMHMGMIPLTSDGRLSNKSIFTRTELKSLHTALHEHLTQDGFKIDKPQPNDKQHLSVMDFKAMKQEERIAKNSEILRDQQQQYETKQKQIDAYATAKQSELKANAQTQVNKINKYKAETLADLNARETALKERESTYKATLAKQYKDEYDERKKTLDAFYAKENDKLTNRESKLRESEYKLDEREKAINERDAEVTRKETNFANKYKKAVRVIKNADEIEKRLDDKIGLYKRLTSTKDDTAILTGLLTSIKQEYGQSVADALYDKAVNGVDATKYVDTHEYDEYKQTKQTHKSKQTDDLEF